MSDVVLKVEKGQGFTQALKQYLQSKGENTKFSGDIWNKIIDTAAQIDKDRKANGEDSIFQGGSDKGDYTKNFILKAGQEIKLKDAEMGLILEKIKPAKEDKKAAATTSEEVAVVNAKSSVAQKKVEETPPIEEGSAPVSKTETTNQDGSITVTNKVNEKVTSTVTRKKDDKTGITTYQVDRNGDQKNLKAFKMKLDDEVYTASVNMDEEIKTLTLSTGFSQELGRPLKVAYTFEQEKGAQFKLEQNLLDMRYWKGID